MQIFCLHYYFGIQYIYIHTLIGISIFDIYFNVQLIIFFILSSPKCFDIVCISNKLPFLYATKPFCEKLYGNKDTTPSPNCSSCFGKSEPILYIYNIYINSIIMIFLVGLIGI